MCLSLLKITHTLLEKKEVKVLFNTVYIIRERRERLQSNSFILRACALGLLIELKEVPTRLHM